MNLGSFFKMHLQEHLKAVYRYNMKKNPNNNQKKGKKNNPKPKNPVALYDLDYS